jgi:hypothetical protein
MKMGKETRTDESVIQIKLAFLGATCNLRLVENAFRKLERIPLYQYANYLSQMALCVELGFKSIIINTDDFEHGHDLENLFAKSPEAFQKKFKAMYPTDMDFNASLSNAKNVFVDFRYMKLDSPLKEYLEESVIDENNTINFKKAAGVAQFQFLRMLLEGIFEYENFMREEALKLMQNPDFKDVDGSITRYIELIKKIQPNIDLGDKSESGS